MKTFLNILGLVLLTLPGVAASDVSIETLEPFDRPLGRGEILETNLETLPDLAQCGGGRTARPRGPLDPFIPYVIHPRDTGLLLDRPSLHWNAAAGATQYTVSLLNGETVLWTKQVDTNQMVYPADEAALQPGIDYTLRVETPEHSSTEDEAESQSFRLLFSVEAQAIQQAEALLPALTTDAAALQKADLYSGAELYSDAITTLEARVAQGTQSATVYRKLGTLYDRADLPLLAEHRYLQATTLATDLEEKAIVQAALGELYGAIEEDREAVRWLTQAQESYTALGNQYQVRQLDRQLQQLLGN